MTKTYMDTYRDVLTKVADIKVEFWLSEHEVVDEEGIFRLLHYSPLTEERYSTPILITYAWINRPYVLDLQPEVSVVQRYLEAGFDVYMIDWGYPTAADQYLDLDDYMYYLDKCVHYVKERKGVKQINLHGYCLGGTLSAAYTALCQKNIKNLILQATPIDFHTDNLLAIWARALDSNMIADAYHSAPGEFLNVGFLLADPVNLIVGKYKGFLDMVESQSGITNFLLMDQWIFDSPDIPGKAYHQYIKQWYQDNLVIKGEFKAMGETVDLNKIEIPVLVLAAMYDHIVPPESQKAIIDAVSSKDKDVYEVEKGHIGITTSKASHKDFWPRAVEWIKQRSEVKQ